MKFTPILVSTMEALAQALENDASVVWVELRILEDAQSLLRRYDYAPVDFPGHNGVLYAHPDVDVTEIHDPKHIL